MSVERKVSRRSWAEINLGHILKNNLYYKDVYSANIPIMAVIKADAYGHGDVEVARILELNKVNMFAVSNISEAIKLRESGIESDILILGYTSVAEFNLLREYNISQTLVSEEYAKYICENVDIAQIRFHFALDTGMNRIGLNADNPEICANTIREYAKKLKIEGVFTHLCVADVPTDENKIFTEHQIMKFDRIVELIRDIDIKFVHCMNSAGGKNYKSKYNNILRLGIILYGLKPDYAEVLPKEISPALTWKTVVSMVKTVRTGETIGYGRKYRANNNMRIATIPTGYADGYSRCLSNKGYVLINGSRAPIVGNICMDQMMVDVSNVLEVKIGDEVVLIGQSQEEVITADDMAHTIGTIGYEVVCNISKRVPRIYFE